MNLLVSLYICYIRLHSINPFPLYAVSFLAEIPVVDEPTVVLDCYDFPSAFKTHHLHDIFREYENMRGGYRIKWKDDTRALIIFEHPTTGKGFWLVSSRWITSC